MGVLIDASILIDAERGRIDLVARVADQPDEEAFLSIITASELLHGVHRAIHVEQRARRAAFVEALLQRLPVLDVDLAAARAHARTRADLAAAGQRIGAHDLWLAATCIAHGLTLVTSNEREFTRVPGLRLQTWRDD